MRILSLFLFFLLASAASATESDHAFEVEEYRVKVGPEPWNSYISTDQSMDVVATRDGVSELSFSDNALTIEVFRNCDAPYAVFRRDERIVIRLVKPLRLGERRTIGCLRMSGTPSRGVVVRPILVYTSYFTCDWMLCDQDRPGDKARFKLRIDFPRGLDDTLGSGTPQLLDYGSHYGLIKWTQIRPYPAHTFGFAAGKLVKASQTVGAVTFDYLAEQGAAADGQALMALFRTTPDMLAYFEIKAGVPFPHARYAQLLVKGTEAQEAAGFSIIGTEMIEPILTDPTEDWVIAHELAHQWWGNLVTCADWTHFWLNEGVVTFMTAAWKEHKHGRTAYDREMELARKRLAVAAEAGFDKPLAWTGEYPSLRIRRAVQYSKGALLLDALRSELGEDAFWAGLKLYTQRHAGGTAVSADFQRAMEDASARDLSAMFKKWVTG